MKIYKKIIVTVFALIILLNPLTIAFANDTPPTPPAPPQAPAAPAPPAAPVAPPPPPQPTQPTPPPPSAPPEPTPQSPEPTSTPGLTDSPSPAPTQTPASPPTNSTPTQNTSASPAGQSVAGQSGNTTIQTGSLTNSAVINTQTNNNAVLDSGSLNPVTQTGAVATNSGNGSNSNNNSSLSSQENLTTQQNNNAITDNNLNLSTATGQNNALYNVGDSSIITGNANASGTVITSANTNLSGVSVSQFNVNENQVGDLVLDFPANCISGCQTLDTSATNSGNGSNSNNNSSISELTNNATFQNNEAAVGSTLTLKADSGGNAAMQNTGGDSNITTGNANASANVVTFLNNNLAGKVVLGVVNLFGDLVGNIILPQNAFTDNSPSNQTTVANSDNGTSSTNSADINQNTTNQTVQNNTSDIQNNVNLSANTGSNQTDQNTGGNSAIQTGEAKVNSQTLNVTNTNAEDGDIWLVLINKAGQWFGQILGTQAGSNFAGSSGTQFAVDNNGAVTAINSGNGTNSQNQSQISQTNNSTTIQNNQGKVVNNINITANTGNNKAMQNTGGDSNVNTGDANVLLNLVNFVNNNINSEHKLIVTVINVFRNWTGDFVPPGVQPIRDPTNNQAANPTPAPQGSPALIDIPDTQTTSFQNLEPSINNSEAISNNQGIILSSGTTKQIVINTSSGRIQVAGFQTTAGNPDNNILGLNKVNPQTKKALTINLAWLLLIIPLLSVILVAIKKKAVILRMF